VSNARFGSRDTLVIDALDRPILGAPDVLEIGGCLRAVVNEEELRAAVVEQVVARFWGRI